MIVDKHEGENDCPLHGRLIGIDYGSVRIGLAICDPSQTWVTPLGTYTRRGAERDATHFERLVRSEEAIGWVVGLPIHCDGKESQKSQEVRRFVSWLGGCTGLPIELFDERFSTAEARRLLAEHPSLSAKKKKARLDGMAAHLILSHFLDSRRDGVSHNDPLDG